MPIRLTTPGLNPTTSIECEAILDTGSDCTLVPITLLITVKAQLADRLIHIPVGGVSTPALPHEVGLVFDRYTHNVIRVFGCPVNDIGPLVLIGRDLMKHYRIEFDGPNDKFTIF